MIMEKPTVEAVRFGSRDVIATSGQLGVQIGGLYNGTSGDWFVSNVKGATTGTQDFSTIAGYFNEAIGLTVYNANNVDNVKYENFTLDGGSSNQAFSAFAGGPYDVMSPGGNDYNGWYIWYSTSGGGFFQWQHE